MILIQKSMQDASFPLVIRGQCVRHRRFSPFLNWALTPKGQAKVKLLVQTTNAMARHSPVKYTPRNRKAPSALGPG